MNQRKVLAGTLLGFFFGLLCASMALVFKPVPLTFLGLLGTVYNRTLIGFLISLAEMKPEWLKGAVIGFLVSYTMTLPVYGLKGIGFAVFGAIYGLVIAVALSRV